MINPKNKRFSYLLAFLLLFNLVAHVFSVQHWPFGKDAELVSLMLIAIVYSFRFRFKKLKNGKDLAKLVLVLTWVILNFCAIFKMQHLIYIRLLLEIATIVWLFLESMDAFKKQHIEDKLNLLVWIGLVLMIIYAICRLSHFPGAGIPMILGPIFLAIGFLIEGIKLNSQSKVLE